MAYNEALQQLGDETAAAVLALYDQLLDGTVSRETFDRQLRYVRERQEAVADNLAALSMAAWLLKETGEAAIARPAVAAADRVASDKAWLRLTATITDKAGADRPAVPRPAARPAARPVAAAAVDSEELARRAKAIAEEVASKRRLAIERTAQQYGKALGQESFHAQMKQSKHVRSWTRKPNADACPLCTMWGAEGRAFPASAKMATHKGCACAQVPSTDRPAY